MDEGVLRALMKATAGSFQRGRHCLDEAQLAAYVDGLLDAATRESAERHLADCRHCRSQAAFLARGEESSENVEVPGDVLARAREMVTAQPRGMGGGWVWRWGAVTAALAGLVLIVTLQVQPPEVAPPIAPAPSAPAVKAPPAGTLPGAPSPAASPSGVRKAPREAVAPRLLYPLENLSLAPSPAEFRWQGVSSSVFYEVQVVSAEGDILWQGTTEGTAIKVPALPPGDKRYVWVRAHLSSGKTVKSEVVGFHVQAR